MSFEIERVHWLALGVTDISIHMVCLDTKNGGKARYIGRLEELLKWIWEDVANGAKITSIWEL